MTRWLTLAALVLGVCVSPPARADACRDEITLASARDSILWLARQTKDFEARARINNPDRSEWGQLLLGVVGYNELSRDRAIERCTQDHWPTAFLHCYVDSDDPWACARRELRQPECLRLENALFGTDMIDHDAGGRCGEPKRRFR